MEIIEAVRIVIGSLLILFLPGFSLSWVFFPKKEEIDWIERIALSIGLSVAVVPLSVFYLNFLFGVKINLVNVITITLMITLFGYVGYKERTNKKISKHLNEHVLKRI